MAGSLTKRGRNVWLVQVFLGRDQAGKQIRHRHTVHGTKEEAQRYLTGFLRDRDLGRYAPPAKMTLDELLDKWLKTVKPDLAPKTYEDYEGNLRRYFRGKLGPVRLDRLNSIQIQEALAEMAAQGLAPRTIQYSRRILGQALKQAVEWGLLQENPVSRTRPVKSRKKPPRRVLDEDETRRFLSAARQDRLGIVLELAVGTGMRPEEYLGLQWADVDLEARTVTVRHVLIWRQQVDPGRPQWTLESPKTKSSIRTIIISPGLVEQLRSWMETQRERQESGAWAASSFVFQTRAGSPIQRRNLANRHLVPVLRAAGIEEEPDAPQHRRLTLYSLRHTHATMLLRAGVNPKVISERLGHTGITMTLDNYTHVMPSMQDLAADQFERTVYHRDGNRYSDGTPGSVCPCCKRPW